MARPAPADDPRDPLIALRIPPSLDQRLRAEAVNTGTTLSEIVRDAITTRLATNPPAAKPMRPRSTSTSQRMCEHRTRQGNYCRRCDGVI